MEDNRMPSRVETDRLLRAIFAEEEPPTFWNRWLGKTIRWIVYLPGTYVTLYGLAWVVALVLGWITGWFHGKVEMNFGTIVMAIVAAILVVSIGVQTIVLVFYAIAAIPNLFCSVVAPNPKVAASIFGTTYVLQILVPISAAIGDQKWIALVLLLLVSAAVMIGTMMAYNSET